jgi:hypothetical protein
MAMNEPTMQKASTGTVIARVLICIVRALPRSATIAARSSASAFSFRPSIVSWCVSSNSLAFSTASALDVSAVRIAEGSELPAPMADASAAPMAAPPGMGSTAPSSGRPSLATSDPSDFQSMSHLEHVVRDADGPAFAEARP